MSQQQTAGAGGTSERGIGIRFRLVRVIFVDGFLPNKPGMCWNPMQLQNKNGVRRVVLPTASAVCP